MHDPMTVAFQIRFLGITIWHVDPEKGGDDDSCDWHGSRRQLNEREKAIIEATWDLETLLDNRPHFPDSPEHKRFQVLKKAIWEWQRRSKWRVPVRWHFWHWSIRIDAVRSLKRMLFSHCCKCGGRFGWGEVVIGYAWHGTGPRWFRAEEHVAHQKCDRGDPVAKAPHSSAQGAR